MDNAQSPLLVARTLRSQGRHGDAATLLQAALHKAPQDPEVLHELGNVLRALGRHDDSLPHLLEATRLCPDNPIYWLNLGVSHFEKDRHALALQAFQKALGLAPDFPEAHNIAACALLGLGRASEAQVHLSTALHLRPTYPAAHDNLGRCLRAQGRMIEALASFEQALTFQASAQTHSNALLALNYIPDIPFADVTARHKNWARLHADRFAPLPSQLTKPRSPREDRLRIGYVSGDLSNHAVAFFLSPILANHDRARFEITCYNNGTSRDLVTARLRGFSEQWREIAHLDDDAVARLIRQDGIDILVDLSGHSARNRLLVFARKPAPIQITWIGYPSTTGLSTIDYRISDAVCIPPGEDALHSTEKILRLPCPFTCYEPSAEAPQTTHLPHDSHGNPPVFCSFNNLAKLSPRTLTVWARILRALPGSRLLLKSPGAEDPGAQANILKALRHLGVSNNQVQFHGRSLPMREHLALYGECHVALDPFPYNGTTTTCEALLMGVPVVTLLGQSHVSRVGASLLTAIGHKQLIAEDEHDYIDIACNLAKDLPRLAALRSGLRAALLQSPLCKAHIFTHHYESALLKIALDALSSEPLSREGAKSRS